MYSMTGFGRASVRTDSLVFTAEIKALNHRFAEFVIYLPRGLNLWEQRLRQQLGDRLTRGRVEVRINMQGQTWPKSVRVDEQFAQQYVKAASDAARLFDMPSGLTAEALMRLPEVIVIEEHEADLESWWPTCQAAFSNALDDMIAMRCVEGGALGKDMASRLDNMSMELTKIESLAANIPDFYRNKLEERLATLDIKTIDENRLAQEVVFFADRADINEELIRLASHIEQLRQTLSADGPVGRRLEFLLQEANREVNTIGSKSQDSQISSSVVELKTELEKLREQAQNVE